MTGPSLEPDNALTEKRLRVILREELDFDRRLAAVEETQERHRTMIEDVQTVVHEAPDLPGKSLSGTPPASWWLGLLTDHAKLIIWLVFVVIFALALLGYLEKVVQVFRGASR